MSPIPQGSPSFTLSISGCVLEGLDETSCASSYADAKDYLEPDL